MRILITGATGFVGTLITEKLLLAGYQIIVVTRNINQAKLKLPFPVEYYQADLSKECLEGKELEDVDGVIHLMGENIFQKWTGENKKKIWDSRVKATENLAKSINANMPRCSFVVSASAIGYYKSVESDRDWIDEKSEVGDNFLSKLTKHWELAWSKLNPTVRKTILRFGVVLDNGGAMDNLLSIFRLGLGSIVGNGSQWMSWIHRYDLVNMIKFFVENDCEGEFNAVSDSPVSNREFSDLLGKFTNRPVLFSIPSFLLSLILGERASTLLDSYRVSNKKITALGFNFKYRSIENALVKICCYEQLVGEREKKFHHFFRNVQFIDKPTDEVFEFFQRKDCLEQITPPSLHLRKIFQSNNNMNPGTKLRYRLTPHKIPISWEIEILNWQPGKGFVDFQRKGPFQVWYHNHLFLSVVEGTLVIDEVKFRIPLGLLGDLFGKNIVDKDVKKLFSYRTQRIADSLTI